MPRGAEIILTSHLNLSSSHTLVFDQRGKKISKKQSDLISQLEFDELTLAFLMWNDEWQFEKDESFLFSLARNRFVIPTVQSFKEFKRFHKKYSTHWKELKSNLISNPLEILINREIDKDRYLLASDFIIKLYHIMVNISLRNLKQYKWSSNFKKSVVPWDRLIVFDPDCQWLCLLNFLSPIYQIPGDNIQVEKLTYIENRIEIDVFSLSVTKTFDEILNELLRKVENSENSICLLEYRRSLDLEILKTDVVINAFICQYFESHGWKGEINIVLHQLKSKGRCITFPGEPEFDVFLVKEKTIVLVETKRRKWITHNERDEITKFFAFFSILKRLLLEFEIYGFFLTTGNYSKCKEITIIDPSFFMTSPDEFIEKIRNLIT